MSGSSSSSTTTTTNNSDPLASGRSWLLQSIDNRAALLWLFTAAFAGLLGGQWTWLASRRPAALLLERGARGSEYQLDVNEATWVEWMQLEGVGPALANRIVADRRLHGPFRSIADLQRVPGIGPQTLDRLRPSLTIRHEHSIAENSRAPH